MAARGREDRAAWTPATRPEPTVRARGISFVPALPIRVVFAEDNYLVREGVVRLLDGVEDVELVAVCEDADSLRAAIVRHGAGRRGHGHPHASDRHRRRAFGSPTNYARRIPVRGSSCSASSSSRRTRSRYSKVARRDGRTC